MKHVSVLAAFVAALALSLCATGGTDEIKSPVASDACAQVQAKMDAGETLTPEQQGCVNREISSEKPTNASDGEADDANPGHAMDRTTRPH